MLVSYSGSLNRPYQSHITRRLKSPRYTTQPAPVRRGGFFCFGVDKLIGWGRTGRRLVLQELARSREERLRSVDFASQRHYIKQKPNQYPIVLGEEARFTRDVIVSAMSQYNKKSPIRN